MGNIKQLYGKLDIASWILPACFFGVINTVVWVKPPWSHQISDGHYNFQIGRHKDSNLIMITCLQNYFLACGILCSPEELLDAKEVNLYVVTLSQEPLDMSLGSHLKYEQLKIGLTFCWTLIKQMVAGA